jgi:phosphoribosylanthranilate isomerase
MNTHRTRIKICGLTREADVDAAVRAGADAVGFVLYEQSPRHVSAERAGELARRLPPFVMPVLLFVNASPEHIARGCAAVPQALLQFHGDETPADCLAAGRPYLRAARIPTGPAGAPPRPSCSTPWSRAMGAVANPSTGQHSLGHIRF